MGVVNELLVQGNDADYQSQGTGMRLWNRTRDGMN